MACGIVNSGVRNECDPALALLTDYVQHDSNVMRLGAIIGLVTCFYLREMYFNFSLFRLGLAYSGSNREDVIEILSPVLWDKNSSFEVIQGTCTCIYVCTCMYVCMYICTYICM